MIGYITLGTNNFERAASFYDVLLAEFGAQRVRDADSYIAWGTGPAQTALSIIKPFDEKPATVGNGVMVSLYGGSQEKVHDVYKKALELGAADEGAPGPRGDNGFYGAYFRDLDGNKLCVFYLV